MLTHLKAFQHEVNRYGKCCLILMEKWRNCSQNHLLWEEAQRSGVSLYLEGSQTCSTAKANQHWISAMGLPVPFCQHFWTCHPCSPLGNSLPGCLS